MVLVVTATGLWAAGVEEESAAATEREMVTDPATGMTWTAPEYGGTLTWATTAYPENTDIWWVSGWAPHLISGVNERLTFANTGDARIFSLDDVESLQKSNPEIDVWLGYGWVESIFPFNWALPPVSDARVRQALQLAVDRDTIANSFYKGYGDPAPHGLVMQAATGWAWPYDEWPEEVKDSYRYDPEAAEALLDEVGYPRGSDGTRFTLKFAQFDRWDPRVWYE